MNVKSCLKVNNGLLYRTVNIKRGRMRLIYQARHAAPRGGRGRQLRVSSLLVHTDESVP
jgi:hypothetical protein